MAIPHWLLSTENRLPCVEAIRGNNKHKGKYKDMFLPNLFPMHPQKLRHNASNLCGNELLGPGFGSKGLKNSMRVHKRPAKAHAR